MATDIRERREELGQTSSTLANQQNSNFLDNQCSRPIDTRSEGGSSRHHSSTGNGRNGNRENPSGGDPDGSDDDDEGDERPHRNNNRDDGPPSSYPSNGGGGGGNPRGGGGGNGPGNNGLYPNTTPQGNVPYGNLVATIRNELKQDQLPVWDGN